MDLNRRQFIEATGAAAIAPLGGQADPADVLGVRRDFSAVRDGLYLNSAYITPSPAVVAEAARSFAERKASKPIPLDEMLKKTDEVRGQFARLVGAAPEEIGFLFATSDGENIVSAALDLKAGDNVVVDELHYNTTFVLYRHLEETRRIELRIVGHRDGGVTADDFARAVDGRTRLLSVAWVSHQNGFRHDIRVLTPANNGSSIVSVQLPAASQTRARDTLDQHGVQVSFRDKGSQIRISPALFNTRDDIHRFLELARGFAA